MRDPESGNSRGFGFISYDSFEASDAAIEVCVFCLYFHILQILRNTSFKYTELDELLVCYLVLLVFLFYFIFLSVIYIFKYLVPLGHSLMLSLCMVNELMLFILEISCASRILF